MSWEGWPHGRQLFLVKRDEAKQEASRLGHQLDEWLLKGQDYLAICLKCGAGATVRRRGLGGPEIGGSSLWFRCSGCRR